MDVIEAIRTRTSVRAFKPTPVPMATLKELLEISTQAPSAMNTQPWEITVLTGQTLDKVRKGNKEAYHMGVEPHPEAPHCAFQGEYRQRQVGLAIQIFQLMGITREDKQKRVEWGERGIRFFDAPAVIILSMNKSLDSSTLSIMDIGIIAQTICLTALTYGLGTCVEDQGVAYPEVVRQFTGIPETSRIMLSIAIGYPERDFPANKLESPREPLEKVVKWCE